MPSAPTTEYSRHLGDLEPIGAIRRNVDRVRVLTSGWTDERFERSYAVGKWTARQILTHLAHTELALGNRARMALSTPDYAAQRFDQDAWIARETRVTGREAVDAFTALARLNGALFEGLSSGERHVASRVRHDHGGLDHPPARRASDSPPAAAREIGLSWELMAEA
jgi:hypothetical protein